MDNTKVKMLEEFVEKELAQDVTGHDISHAMRVMHNAMTIIKEEHSENINEDIILAASLVHDVADHKLFVDLVWQSEQITAVLSEVGFKQNEITEILDIVHTISYREGNNPALRSLNAQIVRDADRLDALGSIGIIRCIAYGTSKGRPFYEEKNLLKENKKITFNKSTNTSLSHFYDKLLKLPSLMHTKTGKKLAKKRIKIMKKFLKSFYLELA